MSTSITTARIRSQAFGEPSPPVPAVTLDHVPGVNGPDPETFEEFWLYYVSQHLHPTTRALHITGTIGAILVGLSGLVARAPKLLVAATFIGLGAAWISHFAIERNKPASFDNPAWSVQADFRLIRRFFNGTLEDDVTNVRRAAGLSDDQVTLADAGRGALDG